ncbi:MAG TPA: hypothetical protein VEC36_12100 [Patescibacteria group bacterium]|nr:hypothetical protein [Patescibacteria group bacterium]
MKTFFNLILVFSVSLLLCTAKANAQLLVGAGPVYSLPLSDFADYNKASFGGTVFIGSRKYCNLWTGMRLDYIAYSQVDPAVTPVYFQDALVLSPEFRYFFSPATEFPVYLQGMLSFSGIKGTDEASRTGLGAGGGVGIVFPYSTNCDWFIDANVRYMAPNLLRSDDRPALSSLTASITFNFGI